MKPELFKLTVEVELVDADGKPIHEGSVLRHIEDGEQGVVTSIVRPGTYAPVFAQIGDIGIETSRGTTRCTNQYKKWRHVPRDQQTYEQRFQAWLHDPDAFEYNGLKYDEHRTDDERKAISGIMALLPEDVVYWENGPWPDSIEQALRFLTEHLEKIAPRASAEGRQ